MSINLRLIAARIIDDVTNGRSLTECLDITMPTLKDPRDRGFVQAICYGVCRFYTRLDVILSYLLQKPMNAKDSDVHALLLVGLYQIIGMRVPPHAAVAETVNATEALNKPWSRGFVNAILREYLRSQEGIEEKLKDDAEAWYAHPLWWIEAMEEACPEHFVAILEANNSHPPFVLRVNQRHHTREQYLEKLTELGIAAQSIPETSHGIILETPTAAEALPGFKAGDISVQDGAAQLAAELLKLAPGLRVLDACAAPGGKLTHIYEIEPALAILVAVEKDKKRIPSIRENLTRLQVKAKIICAKAEDTDAWWDGELFDRILLDAPCSASGVVRRHPDIKLLRQPDDIAAMAEEQHELLAALWPLLKPGGLFLYATCSVFPQENEQVITEFLNTQPDAKEDKIEAAWGLECKSGRQILPGMHNMDGFYYARLHKMEEIEVEIE
jgi:16S rRNA (cytosine967-C5)-methyltransferase